MGRVDEDEVQDGSGEPQELQPLGGDRFVYPATGTRVAFTRGADGAVGGNSSSDYERRVGGTTWHWLGTCLRLLPSDFTLRSRYGRGVTVARDVVLLSSALAVPALIIAAWLLA